MPLQKSVASIDATKIHTRLALSCAVIMAVQHDMRDVGGNGRREVASFPFPTSVSHISGKKRQPSHLV